MKNLKLIITAAILLICFSVYAQKPGYQAYRSVAIVENGVRKESSGSTVYLKFDGNLIFMSVGMPTDFRYILSGTQSDGNQLYYQQAFNNGTIYQGSGWQTNTNSYILISPDRKHFNRRVGQGSIMVYKIQTADSAGSMIY